jgi:hypothetical protein
MSMKRTTAMAGEALIERLRAIAAREGVSLAEVVRQGLEWRANAGRRLRFVGSTWTGQPAAIAEEADTLAPEPALWP